MPKTATPRSKPRAPTMSAQQVIVRINDYHRRVIFPSMFDRLTFDMIAEVEYNFVIEQKRVRVTKSDFWMSSDRADKGHFVIEFKPEDGTHMGRWLHHVVDPNATKGKTTSGKIGFTMNQNVAMSDDVSVVAMAKAYREDI